MPQTKHTMRQIFIKKVCIACASILFLLTLTLAVHLFLVKIKPKPQGQLALGRIDFNQTLDSKKAQSIRDYAASLTGVQNAFCNQLEGTLVFIYSPSKQNPEEIFHKVKYYSQLPAKRYMPRPASSGGGCTAGFGENSTASKAISFISKTILSE